MLEKYIGTRSEHYGEIKTFSEGMFTLKMKMGNRQRMLTKGTHFSTTKHIHSVGNIHSVHRLTAKCRVMAREDRTL